MLLLLLACADKGSVVIAEVPVEDSAIPPVVCPEIFDAVATGKISEPTLGEISGVVESRVNDGVLWVHNDSGDSPHLYALSTDGTLRATWLLVAAPSGDWEDIAVGSDGAGGGLLYVGDIGDNAQARESIAVHRVPEPAVIDSDQIQGVGFDTLTLTYPDAPLNAETLLLDPLTDDLYIITKDYAGAAGIFRKAAPHVGGESAVLEEIAWLDFITEPLTGGATTGGDISPDGRLIVIRTYRTTAFVWLRQYGQTVAEALAGEPCIIELPSEQQGESVGFSADGTALWSISEGGASSVYSVPLQ